MAEEENVLSHQQLSTEDANRDDPHASSEETQIAGVSITTEVNDLDVENKKQSQITDEEAKTMHMEQDRDIEEEGKYELITKVDAIKKPHALKKTITLYSSMGQTDEALSLPYKNKCASKMKYHFDTFLITHTRIYALYLLYQSTWPRGLVLLDMYTDIKVGLSLYENGESFWFMLSSMFIVLPFVLVWTVSLRFIQKFINKAYSNQKSNTKCMSILINTLLSLYIFPPIGAVIVALYEIYLVFYDIYHGIKCCILGTGLVETQTNEVQAMKKYRRCIEIFAESVPQTMLQLYMFIRHVKVDKNDLYLSIAISAFNLLINAYHFRKEAQLHGMSVAEFALSVLQLAEIPIFRLVPRLPAVKKGQLEFVNLAAFTFDKESIAPINEALSAVSCLLSCMKISLGSLLHLDLESCRLIGSIIKKRKIKVYISGAFSLLNIKNIFEQIDEDHNGYLDEYEFEKALKTLHNGLIHADEMKQKRIFQKLAIRRIKKRDRVYFYDFFKSIASIENEKIEFDMSQIDYPLHYVFETMATKIRNKRKSDLDTMKKLYFFCAGLEYFDEIDYAVNTHIFFAIIDVLIAINDTNSISFSYDAERKFVRQCFAEILSSDTFINKALNLLIRRNRIFDTELEENVYKPFVIDMYKDREHNKYDGLNVFEYCFAFKNKNYCYIFVHLLNVYLKTQSTEDAKKSFQDENGALYHIYNASKFKWEEKETDDKLPIEYAAEEGLFNVVEYFCKYMISDYAENVDELLKTCHILLTNKAHHNPDTFALLLQQTKEQNNLNLVDENGNKMATDIMNAQRNIYMNQTKQSINKSQATQLNSELLRYFDILCKFGFDFSQNKVFHKAIDMTRTRKIRMEDILLQNDIQQSEITQAMSKIIEICRQKGDQDIHRLLNECQADREQPIMTAFSKDNLEVILFLLKCPEQDCNILFEQIWDDVRCGIKVSFWIKFLIAIFIGDLGIQNLSKRVSYELKRRMNKTLDAILNTNEFDDKHEMLSQLCAVLRDDASSSAAVEAEPENIAKNVKQTEYKDETEETQESKEIEVKEDALDRKIKECQVACQRLKRRIKMINANPTNANILARVCNDIHVDSYIPKLRLLNTGHMGKIYALHWGHDSENIITASQDGKLIIWKAHSGNKQLAITLNSAWVMSCCFSPTYKYVASGGLDNTVSIFKTSSSDSINTRFRSKDLYRELEKHDGYMACSRFIDDNTILSASGDGTCILWDIESRKPKNIFMEHTADVMAVDLNPVDANLFVSGSVDATVNVWDMRASDEYIYSFVGPESDVNTVKWMSDGKCIACGSDDGTVRLFDMKTFREMNKYCDEENKSLHSQDLAGVTCVDFTGSGSYIFASYDNGQVHMWSTLTAKCVDTLPHESRVAAVGVSPDGYQLATGCWDFNLRLFA